MKVLSTAILIFFIGVVASKEIALDHLKLEDWKSGEEDLGPYIEFTNQKIDDFTFFYIDDLNFEVSGHLTGLYRAQLSSQNPNSIALGAFQSYISGRSEEGFKLIIDPITIAAVPEIPKAFARDIQNYIEAAKATISKEVRSYLMKFYRDKMLKKIEDDLKKSVEQKHGGEL